MAKMTGKSSSAAAASMAGYLLQVHRAVHRLERAAVGDYVGVEALDDVVVHAADGSETWEQDKFTLADGGSPLTDRSKDFWRTLDIWTDAWVSRGLNERNASFYLVTNRVITGAALARLTVVSRDDTENEAIVALLNDQQKDVGEDEDKTLQALINHVLSKGEVLARVIACALLQAGPGEIDLELVERTKAHLPFAGLGLNEDVAYESLIGWVERALFAKWFNKEEGWIGKDAFNRQVYSITESMKRRVILPQAARVLPVTDDDREKVRNHRFVDHLGMIDITGARLDEELAHYIRFSREKFRLTESGDVVEEHWLERADRLKAHWRLIKEGRCLDHVGEPLNTVGRRIFNDVSKIREELAGVNMPEAYITIGHYHRLADHDQVAWHPDFECQESQD